MSRRTEEICQLVDRWGSAITLALVRSGAIPRPRFSNLRRRKSPLLPGSSRSLPTEIPLADHSNDSQSKLGMRDRLRCDQRQHDRSATNQSGSVRSSR